MPNTPEWETSSSWQSPQNVASDANAPTPAQGQPMSRGKRRRVVRLVVLLSLVEVLAVLMFLAGRSGALETLWNLITGHQISLTGAPVAATHSKLSEHEREYILRQRPQQQAEMLMEAAVNHDQGATDLIMQQLPSWEGKLHRSKRWDDLELTARYSNDLRVRAAAVETDIVVYGLTKSPESADSLIESAEQNPSSRALIAYELGMLANRGVAVDRIHEWLRKMAHDSDEQTRYWAVEGLAFIGTDDTIPDFLDVLANDPSLNVRERGGCSLAKSGMLTREQRMKAVPGLIGLADNASLDPTTHGWVYQALREITDENIANDPASWRNWWDTKGQEKLQQMAQNPDSVRGNN
jgi:hypothetical protein